MKTIKLFFAVYLMVYTTAVMAADGALVMSGGGNGSQATPYKLANYTDLLTFRTAINAGTDLSAYVELSANINATGNTWNGIGTTTNYFKGSFDGKGYTISGLTNNSISGTTSPFGFFNHVSNGTNIKNLNLSGISYTSSTTNSISIGGLIGSIIVAGTVTIDNCNVSGTINSTVASTSTSSATLRAAGLVGQNSPGSNTACILNISNCSSSVNITAASNSTATNGTARQVSCGGILADVASGSVFYIVNCFASGSISASSIGAVYAGGIIANNGVATSKIYNCYSAMTIDALTSNLITSPATVSVGGIAGTFGGASEIKNCIALNTHLQARTANSAATNINVVRIGNGTITGFATNYGYATMDLQRSISWTGTISGGSGTTTAITPTSSATGKDGLTTTATTVSTAATEALGYLNGALATYSAYTPKTWSMTGVNNPAFDNSISFATKTYSKTTADAAFTQLPSLTNSKGAVTYASNATGVATVDANTGLVTIVGAGSARITATQVASGSYAGATDYFDINVAPGISASVTPTTLTGFSYEYGSGPSTEQSFTITGTGLSSAITLTAPTHFEISTGTGVDFVATSPISINPASGSVSSTIYLRMKAGLAVGAYSTENITIASSDFTTKNVSCSGSVVHTVAATIYVDGSMANDNGTGLSWATAKKSITTAAALATVSGDVVYVKGGTYNFTKTSPSAAGAFGTNAGVSFYGSFAGTETAPSQRATSDVDGNGIVEPWEFSNQTILNFTLTGSASGFSTSNASGIVTSINGFKFTGTNTASDFSSTNVTVTMRISKYVRFENNIVADWTVTGNLSGASAASLAAPFFDVTSAATYGNIVVNNCLFEKNTITYTSTQSTLNSFHPFIALGTAQALNRNLMSNCVVRNNMITMDFSGSTITGTETAAPRGLIVSILAPTVGYPTTLKNSIIHNNEVSFIPSATLLTAYGAPVYVYNSSNTSMSDSIINNTIANNKTTKCNSAGIKFGMDLGGAAAPNHIIMNNVMYNNKNDGAIKNFEANLAVPDASAIIKNNICNGGNFTSGGSIPFVNSNSNVVGNLFDLSDTNTDATLGAFFSNPTTTIGYVADGTVELSRWTIGASSYLKAKGIATTNKYDKSGYIFAPSSPSVGAYESSLIVAAGSSQTIATTTYLNSLTINAGGQLTLSNGALLTVGSLNLLSDATNGTGTFVDQNNNGGLTVTGTTTVNQSFQHPAGALRTWYVTPPVASAAPTGMSIIKSYDELTYSWSAHTSTMVAKKGYQVVPAAAANDISFTGTLNNGNQNISLISRTGIDNKAGFNLIGNPYPSYLDWSLVTNPSNTAAMRSTTMWYRTKKLNQSSQLVYQFWTVNGDGVTSPNGASSKIPPMQAFWVRANAGGGTLALTNAMRSHAPDTDKLLKAPSAKNTANTLVRLQVSNGTNTDEAVLYFSANASNGLDGYDSPKMSNDNVTIPEIYTTLGSEQIVINGMNSIPLDTPIGLGFVAGNASSFSLFANEISNLPNGVKVILKDNVTKAETDLTDGVSTYQFSPVVTNSDRFSVIFRTSGAVSGLENTQDNNILVYNNAPQQLTVICNDLLNLGSMVSVYNALGQKLLSQKLTATSMQIDGTFTKGVYVVKVNNTTKKVIFN